MSTAVQPTSALGDSYARAVPELVRPWRAATAPSPRLLALNADLADDLGLDPDALRSPAGVDLLVGNTAPEGATPVAMLYAGHQFGNYSPRLGDGRALLLGELVDPTGRRHDLHLKGSGRTPFARGGDGFAAVGPMLREYVVGEAVHALGIPTTRALAVVATGAEIARETMLPGAVLARVAASHLRVGTFQYAAHVDDPTLVPRLLDHAIARHHPQARDAANPALAFFEAVVEAQASLVARWMLVGFVHGVMNTDNMTISGETIDYGPCAFVDAFDAATVFSSIDHGGRYAYGNQPRAAAWNLARLAETLLPVVDDDPDAAVEAVTAVLATFPDRYDGHFSRGMAAKLGLPDGPGDDTALADDLLTMLQAQHVDHTLFFRSLADAARGDESAVRDRFLDREAFDTWAARWRTRLAGDGRATAEAMDRVNPLYIPRNHRVEEALAAATAGDLAPFERLVEVVSRPFDERPGLAEFTTPGPSDGYVTYCGT